MIETFDEFLANWREMEKQPKDPNVTITCLCGKHETIYVSPTDEELLEMYNVIYKTT